MRAQNIGLLAALVLSGCREGDWPDRPILLVCPWAAGGGTDRVSRTLAAHLKEELRVPVNVINDTGGAGVTGHSRGASARPDGYTVTMMTVEINMLRWRGLTRISWEDFAPLMLLNRDAAALFVRSDAPWKSLQELIAGVREKPGRLTASGTAIGGIWHLALTGCLRAVGLSPTAVRWVPMGGAGPSLQELVSGGLDLVCCSLPEARTLLGSGPGSLRCLGVMAEERLAAYPDVPTCREQGVDWVLGGWRGLGLPRGTPESITGAFVAALQRIVTGKTELNGSRFPDFMAREGFDASWEVGEEFRETLGRTDAELRRLLTSAEFAGMSEGPVGPYGFPVLIGAILALVLAALALERRRRGTSASAPLAADSGNGATWRPWQRVLEVAAAVAAFGAFVEGLGFIICAGGVLAFLLWRLGNGWRLSLCVTLVVVPGVYQLFVHVVGVPFPRGVLGW